MIGLAVMGRNLALNILDHGFSVAAYNLEPELTLQAVEESQGQLVATQDLKQLVAVLTRPRKIMLLIKAGEPVDLVLDELQPLLEVGDIVIDGGNSRYQDTRRREQRYAKVGLRFFGVGVSGGAAGARHGPSLMPGGNSEAYQELREIFEAISAKTELGACVTHVGTDGAGHFVKMVHNGIEYADMQLIAEAYHILAELGGLKPDALAQVFADWNGGPLESYLVEITAKILAVRDDQSDVFLVDRVLDRAGQKGTGLWTVQAALSLGVPIPGIAAALDARLLSSMKEERQRASGLLQGPSPSRYEGDIKTLVHTVHDALYAAKIVAYAQGMSLISAGSLKYNWSINMSEIARIWKGGCIIRARLLDTVVRAYANPGQLENLLLDRTLRASLDKHQLAWRSVVSLATNQGIPVPGMSASLAYFDSYRSARLPQNLTQAQRDAFGAHTYQRTDDPNGAFLHSNWLD